MSDHTDLEKFNFMLKTKEDFIKKYESIYDSFFAIERKIEEIEENKIMVIESPDILSSLKQKIGEIIDDLNKTREHERKIFKY